MENIIYQWIDLFWLVMVLVAVHKQHRLLAAGYVLSCVFMLRLQVEIMGSIHYSTGILRVMDSDVFDRGLIVYSVFYLLYFLMAHYSPGSRQVIFMAASLSIFFFALSVSTFVMVL